MTKKRTNRPAPYWQQWHEDLREERKRQKPVSPDLREILERLERAKRSIRVWPSGVVDPSAWALLKAKTPRQPVEPSSCPRGSEAFWQRVRKVSDLASASWPDWKKDLTIGASPPASAAPAPAQLRPEVGSVWRHHSGRQYRVRKLANSESTRPEYPETVIYENAETGSTWARPLSDWHRSMELVDSGAAPPAPAPAPAPAPPAPAPAATEAEAPAPAATEAEARFDFEDGNGPVPAHRHQNPDGFLGGWVASTATVACSASVGPKALVYGRAKVLDTSGVWGEARVFDEATVAGGSQVADYARVNGQAHIYKSRVVGSAQIFGTALVCRETLSSEVRS